MTDIPAVMAHSNISMMRHYIDSKLEGRNRVRNYVNDLSL